MAQWVGVQVKVKVDKKSKNTSTCSGHASEPQTENENRFFRFQAEDLLNPTMVWIALQLNRVASYSVANSRQNFGGRGTSSVKSTILKIFKNFQGCWKIFKDDKMFFKNQE